MPSMKIIGLAEIKLSVLQLVNYWYYNKEELKLFKIFKPRSVGRAD